MINSNFLRFGNHLLIQHHLAVRRGYSVVWKSSWQLHSLVHKFYDDHSNRSLLHQMVFLANKCGRCDCLSTKQHGGTENHLEIEVLLKVSTNETEEFC
jgi:hypothetical protein